MGKRLDGAHRRLSPDGPRLLNDNDRTPEGIPRVVMNDIENTIIGKTGVEPRYDEIKWLEVQAQIKVRGKCQRGIPRAKDRGKYPLATRIIDLTDGCGSIMYGKTNGKKRLYTCGRYMASAGAECEHNSVDAEALLNFVLKSIQLLVQKIGTRDNLLRRLEIQDGQRSRSQPHLLQQELQRLESERLDIAERVSNAERRMASETNDDRYEAIGKQFDQFKSELRALDAEIAVRRMQIATVGQNENVEGALQIFDRVSKILADPTHGDGSSNWAANWTDFRRRSIRQESSIKAAGIGDYHFWRPGTARSATWQIPISKKRRGFPVRSERCDTIGA